MLVDGKPVEIDSPSDAIKLGIGMVHQHFMLVPVMTVAENIVLGQEPTRRGGVLDLKAARTRVRELSDRYGLAVDPDAVIEDITVGAQQRVEILKALYRNARILVLDEPTAVLTAQEVRELTGVLNRLKQDGAAIVFISHKLGEVLQVADRITVLRRGKKVDTVPRKGATELTLARLVVGRDVMLAVDKTTGKPEGAAAPGRRPARARRPRAREGVRAVAVGPGGRDRCHRRRRRQRPAGVGRCDHGDARTGVGRGEGRWSGYRRPGGSGGDRGRRGPHCRGPPSPRARAPVHAFREPGAARVPQAGLQRRRLAAAQLLEGAGEAAAEGIRCPRRWSGVVRGVALGRQPAEGMRGPRDRLGPEAARRAPADEGTRRRRDRVRPSPTDRGARQGSGGTTRFARVRGGPGAGRPDPRDLRG